MPKLLALDIATHMGFASLDTKSSFATIHSGTIKAEGDTVLDKAASIALLVEKLVQEIHPDIVAIYDLQRCFKKVDDKQPQEIARAVNILPTSLLFKPVMTGAVTTILTNLSIPIIRLDSYKCRKFVLGYARKSGLSKSDWQKALADKLRSDNIPIKNVLSAPAIALVMTASREQQVRLLDMEAAQ